MARPDAFSASVTSIARRSNAPLTRAPKGPLARSGRRAAPQARPKRRWAGDGLVRETFRMTHAEARDKARTYLDRYPRQAYMTRVEHWARLADGAIEFTMVRLPTAD